MATLFYGSDGETHYELEWDFSIQKPRGNWNGLHGWAKVLRSTGSRRCLTVEPMVKVHLCEFTPCAADFPANKYRTGVAPWHLRRTAWRPAASAVAEAAAAPEAEPGSLPHPAERDGPAGAMGRVAGPPECDGPATAVAVAAGPPEGDGEGDGALGPPNPSCGFGPPHQQRSKQRLLQQRRRGRGRVAAEVALPRACYAATTSMACGAG